MSDNQSSGFTWSIKELLPLLIGILGAIGTLVGVYSAMSARITALETDLMYTKKEIATLIEKVNKLDTSIITIQQHMVSR